MPKVIWQKLCCKKADQVEPFLYKVCFRHVDTFATLHMDKDKKLEKEERLRMLWKVNIV